MAQSGQWLSLALILILILAGIVGLKMGGPWLWAAAEPVFVTY